MAEVIRVIPEGEPRKKNTLVIHIETEDANKKLDELIEKANQLKATLRECGIPADLEKTGGTEEMLGTIAICKYRTVLNMTQAQLAAIVGVTPNAITQYESGARKPNIIMLKKLARALHTTTDALLESIDIEDNTNKA